MGRPIKDLTDQRFGRLIAVRPTKERRWNMVVWELICDCGNTHHTIASSLIRGDVCSCGCIVKADLRGKRFGRLTAIEPTGERKNRTVVWKCVCDCGNVVYVTANALNMRQTKSCGCLHRDVTHAYAHDLSGQTFGRLTAIKPTDERKNRSVIWECLCNCGKTIQVSAIALRTGNTQSCGCQRQDATRNTSIDLSNQRFDRLIVLKPTHKREKNGGSIIWECACDCGKKVFASVKALRSGGVRSCGCLLEDNRYKLDLKNQRYGRLLVIAPTIRRTGTSILWQCICDCGKIVLISATNLNRGVTRSCGCLGRDVAASRKGPKSQNWNPDLSAVERIVGRKYTAYYSWRTSIYERDDYTCQVCGGRGKKINAHHIVSYEDNEKLRTNLSNGITLCTNCHDDYHRRYGRKHANSKDFAAWFKQLELEKHLERGDFDMEEEHAHTY